MGSIMDSPGSTASIFPSLSHLRRVKPLPRWKRRKTEAADDHQNGLPENSLGAKKTRSHNHRHISPSVTSSALNSITPTTSESSHQNTNDHTTSFASSLSPNHPYINASSDKNGFVVKFNLPMDSSSSGSDDEDTLDRADTSGFGSTFSDTDPHNRDDRDQQGNTKKRKVPSATRHRSRMESELLDLENVDWKDGNPVFLPSTGDVSSKLASSGDKSSNIDGNSEAEKWPTDSAHLPLPLRTIDNNLPSSAQRLHDRKLSSPSLSSRAATSSKLRISTAAVAGMKLKEIMKQRRRQLTAVLGSLASSYDPLALSQALSAPLDWRVSGEELFKGMSIGRWTNSEIRRKRRWKLKALKASIAAARSEAKQRMLEGFEFNFSFPSSTSDRMAAVRKEVASLETQFTEELQRLSALREAEVKKKAQEAAALSRELKRVQKQKSLASSTPLPTPTKSTNSQTSSPVQNESIGTPVKKNGKKKKRSALANASNPHHLRNYVPSRIPSNSGPPPNSNNPQAISQSLLSPLPFLFLSAELRVKPGRERHDPASTPSAPDEWICPNCEYDLFYGDDADFRKAIRNRKKILRRKRRAQERAAAAAAGKDSTGLTKSEDKRGELLPEDQPAKFADPAEVEARVNATMVKGPPVSKDPDREVAREVG